MTFDNGVSGGQGYVQISQVAVSQRAVWAAAHKLAAVTLSEAQEIIAQAQTTGLLTDQAATVMRAILPRSMLSGQTVPEINRQRGHLLRAMLRAALLMHPADTSP